MAKKRLPMDFTSFVQFHDFIKKEKPELFKEKTTRFKSQKVVDDDKYGGDTITYVEDYTISIAALERLCWKEIEKDRLTKDEIREVESRLYQSGMDYTKQVRVREFLKLFRY